jgi:hypothetical protein
LSVCSPNSPWFTTCSELVRWCMSVCRMSFVRQAVATSEEPSTSSNPFVPLLAEEVCVPCLQ